MDHPEGSHTLCCFVTVSNDLIGADDPFISIRASPLGPSFLPSVEASIRLSGSPPAGFSKALSPVTIAAIRFRFRTVKLASGQRGSQSRRSRGDDNAPASVLSHRFPSTRNPPTIPTPRPFQADAGTWQFGLPEILVFTCHLVFVSLSNFTMRACDQLQ